MTKPNTILPSIPKNALIVLGKLFTIARKEQGWRQKDLAERIGITRQTVSRLELGDPNIAIGYYFTAAWLLDIPLFPGIEFNSKLPQKASLQLFELLKNKFPQRIIKKDKPIDNNF